MVRRTSDMQNVVRTESVRVLMACSKLRLIGCRYLSRYMLRALSYIQLWGLPNGPVSLLRQMVHCHGFGKENGLDPEIIVGYAAEALSHKDREVRNAGYVVTMEAYKKCGPSISKYLVKLRAEVMMVVQKGFKAIQASPDSA
eukprot:gnl/Hemi2/24059_TR8074_c0_g1_i1.p2 gnl/Hemi2/24059_TR8074_c0_g1~~gnl/Hemi2/24059_TR8074_c0_g1_i1.p2  ORF type:complete len:142 (-),score=35.85 gnl/Hemi2/24059_TR8074_c0_g1_i1:239-664(-)